MDLQGVEKVALCKYVILMIKSKSVLQLKVFKLHKPLTVLTTVFNRQLSKNDC